MVGLLGFVKGLQKQIIINENAAVIYSAYVPIQLFNLPLPQDASSRERALAGGTWVMNFMTACFKDGQCQKYMHALQLRVSQ